MKFKPIRTQESSRKIMNKITYIYQLVFSCLVGQGRNTKTLDTVSSLGFNNVQQYAPEIGQSKKHVNLHRINKDLEF